MSFSPDTDVKSYENAFDEDSSTYFESSDSVCSIGIDVGENFLLEL
jgi:hypothetical protein